MYTFLPDELLKEILAPALQVPDESFACTSGRSPFSNYNKTTSAYLLVCKDWLRVATPLLYSVVVLRSRAQIQALEAAIDSTPVLGGLIKKLRVESGYCGSLLTILKHTTKSLTDLCLSLEVYSGDHVAAVGKGMGLINPTRLIIFDMYHHHTRHTNQKAQQFMESIQENIAKWDKLTKVVLPSWPHYWETNTRYEGFVDAICKSRTIEVVSIASQYMYHSWFDRLSNTPSLKKIIIRNANGNGNSFVDKVNSSPKLKSLVQWGEYDNTAVIRRFLAMRRATSHVATVESTLYGMNTPDIARDWLKTFPDVVWNNILFYAMGLHELEQEDISQLGKHIRTEYFPRNRRHLVHVCQKFHELAIPLYYRCIIILEDDDLHNLVEFLTRRRDMGKRIKTLYLVHKNHGSLLTHNLGKLLSYTPNLRRVSSVLSGRAYCTNHSCDIFDWQALSTLSQKAGPRIVDLAINLHRPTQPKSPELFHHFTRIKYLAFSSSAKFCFEPDEVDKKAFKHLESVLCSSINNSFLSFLSHIDLPSLKNARFPVLDKSEGVITFLRRHGVKLVSLELGFLPGVNVFDTCTNLRQFIVPHEKTGFAVAEFFSSSEEHPLENLHITTRDVARGAEKEKFKYVGGLDLSNFTSLREIKIDRCSWPTTENEIKKSHWVVWAERLHVLYQVDIIDSEGQKWVPRLKAKKTK